MARLKNTKTGAIVSVRDEKVLAMGSDWVSAEVETKKAPAKKAASSKSRSE